MPEPVIIANRPFWARILAVLWGVQTVMGLVFTWTGWGWLGAPENGMAWLLIIMGLLLAGSGAVMADVTRRVAILKGAAIEMRPEGFRDRRLSQQLIPWEAMRWSVVFNGRSYSLQFDLAPGLRSRYRTGWGNRLLAAANRRLRRPEFTVLTLGTGRSAQQLADAMERFKTAQT